MNETTKAQINNKVTKITRLIDRRAHLLRKLSQVGDGGPRDNRIYVYVGRDSSCPLKVDNETAYGTAAFALSEALIGAVRQNVEAAITDLDVIIDSMEAQIG